MTGEKQDDAARYVEGSREAAREFDSRIFWLAGGAIALSLTFYKDLAAVGAVQSVWLLFGGWLSLVAAIVLVMVSFQLCVRSCHAFIRYEQDGRRNRADYDLGVSSSNAVSGFNWAALIAVAVGVVLVCAFFAANADFAERKGRANDRAKETRSSTNSHSTTTAKAPGSAWRATSRQEGLAATATASSKTRTPRLAPGTALG